MLFSTEAEARQHTEIYGGLNYTWLPCDDPLRGVKGLIGFVESEAEADDEGEANVIVEWPLFGRPLEPHVQESTPEQILAFVEVTPDAFRYDDPKHLRLGALAYQAEQGVTLVHCTSVGALRNTPPEVRERLLAWRENHANLNYSL